MLEISSSTKSDDINSSMQIGEYTIFPHINYLSGPSGKFNISSRTMRLLLCFQEHEGVAISKHELLQNVWNNVVVTEDSLTKSVSELRRVLGNPQTSGVEIETIRGVGYRFKTKARINKKLKSIHFIYSSKIRIAALMGLIVTLISLILINNYTRVNQTDLINLTNNDWEQRVPRLSPDGSKLLYAAVQEGWNNFNIYIVDLNREKVKAITSSNSLNTDPIWSPDGKSIAYLKNDGSRVSLLIKNLGESVIKELTHINGIAGLSAMEWSPLNNRIIYADRRRQSQAFALISINPKKPDAKDQLTHPQVNIIGDSSPRISPDGKNLSFIRTIKRGRLYHHLIPGIGEVFIKKNNENEKQLTTLNTEISGVAWIDDMTVIFSATYQNYLFQIIKMDIESLKSSVIFETKNLIRNLDYHIETKQIVFESWDIDHSIWTFTTQQKDLDFSGQYFSDGYNYWEPAFSNTGNHFAYFSDRSGVAELWVRDTNKKLDTKVNHKLDGVIQGPVWSPDGRSLMYEVISDTGNHINRYDLANKLTKPLVVSEGLGSFPQWLEDGLGYYFSSNISGRHEIYKSDFDNPASQTQITFQGGLRCIQFNGLLYYSKAYYPGIWLKTEDGEKKLLDYPTFQDNKNWQITASHLYFIKRDKYFRPELFSYDLVSNEISLVQSFNYPMSIDFSGFSLHPDKQSFLITLNTQRKSDILRYSYKFTALKYLNIGSP